MPVAALNFKLAHNVSFRRQMPDVRLDPNTVVKLRYDAVRSTLIQAGLFSFANVIQNTEEARRGHDSAGDVYAVDRSAMFPATFEIIYEGAAPASVRLQVRLGQGENAAVRAAIDALSRFPLDVRYDVEKPEIQWYR